MHQVMLPYAPSKIVRGVNQKDPEINRWIYNFFFPAVARSVRAQIGNSQDLDDLISTVFLKFWSHKKEFKVFKDIRDYMKISTFHVWSDYLKQQKEDKTDSFAIVDFKLSQKPDEQYSEAKSYFLELIFGKIEELSPKTKDVILLYCQELPDEEIAKKLGMSVKTVKNHKSEALKFLKLELKRKKSEIQLPIILLLINLLYDKL